MKNALILLLLTITNIAVGDDSFFFNKKPLAVSLKADFSKITDLKIERRAREKAEDYKERYIDGQLTLRQINKTFNVKLFVRGRSRLSCKWPPLKVVFKEKEIIGTIFEGNKKMKLYTHCGYWKPRVSKERIFREYKMYEKFSLISSIHLKSSLLDIKYIDQNGNEITHNLGFFIESTKSFRLRTGFKKVELDIDNDTVKDFFEIDEHQLLLIKEFNQSIKNYDTYLEKSLGNKYHASNIKLFEDQNGTLIPVPYDFDWSKQVNRRFFLFYKSPKLQK